MAANDIYFKSKKALLIFDLKKKTVIDFHIAFLF